MSNHPRPYIRYAWQGKNRFPTKRIMRQNNALRDYFARMIRQRRKTEDADMEERKVRGMLG